MGGMGEKGAFLCTILSMSPKQKREKYKENCKTLYMRFKMKCETILLFSIVL